MWWQWGYLWWRPSEPGSWCHAVAVDVSDADDVVWSQSATGQYCPDDEGQEGAML